MSTRYGAQDPDVVAVASEDSFPASDPPPYSGLVAGGPLRAGHSAFRVAPRLRSYSAPVSAPRFGDERLNIVKAAFEEAWSALEFAYRPNSEDENHARELLALLIYELAAESEEGQRALCAAALQRFPPVTAYYNGLAALRGR